MFEVNRTGMGSTLSQSVTKVVSSRLLGSMDRPHVLV